MHGPVFDYLAKRAELSPRREALVEIATGDRVDYAELERRAGCAASLLAACGVHAGDRVALLCRNRIAFFELLFACGKLGAVLVPLNWRMPPAELIPLIEDSMPRVLLHGAEDAQTALALAGRVSGVVGLDHDGSEGYAMRRDAHDPHPGRGTWNGNEPWYLLYTSGTTGQPKAVIQTYGMALANYVNISQGMGLRGDDTTLNFLPLFHTGGINLTTLPALLDGARVLVLPAFDLDAVVRLLGDRALDHFFGVPAVYQALSLHPDFDDLDLAHVRAWACGGAPLPDVLVRRFAQHGARVMNGMGMTETGPTVFLMDADSVEEKVGSVGKPQLLAAARIMDPEGREVAEGGTGELWFSGPGVTPGYWNRAEATADAFQDGWLKSGDLGRRDADGYYYIVGRLKEMFISGGENVYPAEVENVLASHPDILEAAVVGVPDERWGEVGRAFLLPRPGHALPVPDQLCSWCRERLAAYKVPHSFRVLAEFPRTAAGKVQKHLLVEQDRHHD